LTTKGTITLNPTAAPSADTPEGPAGMGVLEWLNARIYDPSTRSFLSTDPLPPITGASWAANPYHYAANNPLSFTDPTGLRPMTDADLRAYTDRHSQGLVANAWSATTDWISHNWEYIAAGAAIAAGVALMFTGIGGPAGLILIGAASGALISGGVTIATQKATTGTVDWGQVGKATIEGAALGAATGGMILVAGQLVAASRIATLTQQGSITSRTASALMPIEATVSTDTVVLEHYPAYVDLARATGGRTFQVPTKIWDSMSTTEQWAANQRFLDRAISRSSDIRLATPASRAREGSYFERELQYLQSNGYTVAPDGMSLNLPTSP
jgi:RHS repeat-associated protein